LRPQRRRSPRTRARRQVRERITLCRHDIAKIIATGIEEAVATRKGGQGAADWQEIHAAFRSIVDQIPRTATTQELEPIAEELSQLVDDVLNLLDAHIKAQNLSANESHDEHHIQN
jgi:replication initiation protein RepC